MPIYYGIISLDPNEAVGLNKIGPRVLRSLMSAGFLILYLTTNF